MKLFDCLETFKKCGVPFQMVVLESAPEKALEATVDKWLEWDLGETRQEVTREKKFFGYHLLEVCLILVPPPS